MRNKDDQARMGELYQGILEERFQVGTDQKAGAGRHSKGAFSNDQRAKVGSGFMSQQQFEDGIRTMLSRAIVKYANPQNDGLGLDDAVAAAKRDLDDLTSKSFEELQATATAPKGVPPVTKVVAAAMVNTIKGMIDEGEQVGRAEQKAAEEIEKFAHSQMNAAVEQAKKLAANFDFSL